MRSQAVIPIVFIFAWFHLVYPGSVAGQPTREELSVFITLIKPMPPGEKFRVYMGHPSPPENGFLGAGTNRLFYGPVAELATLSSDGNKSFVVPLRKSSKKLDGEAQYVEEIIFVSHKSQTHWKISNLDYEKDRAILVMPADYEAPRYRRQAGTTVHIQFDPEQPHKSQVVQCLGVTLDRAVKDVEVKEESVELTAGVVQEYKAKREIERSVTFGAKAELGANFEVSFLRSITMGVRASIELSAQTTYKETDTIEKGLSLDGSKIQKVTVVWYDQYRTGKTNLLVNGKETSVPFEFREGFALKARAAK